jgi:hypothetical protein
MIRRSWKASENLTEHVLTAWPRITEERVVQAEHESQ